jgi:nucleotide-binding universal stress UspA family protein
MAVRPVVVGVDGSASAYRAVEWAAGEAHRRGVGLRLVRAFSWTTADHPTGWVARYRNEMLDVSRRQVARAVRVAADTRSDVEAESQVAIGAPIEVLSSEARRAQLLVLGDRGLGEVAGLVLGSVAVSLAASGACPVVVVRGERAGADGAVVVGVDGSPVSEAALAFAFDAAAARGVDLVAVHAWSPTAIDEELASLVEWDASAESAVLAERLAGWGQKYPQVAVRRTVVRDGAVRALVAASAGAQLVVVGSRGRGNAAGLLLGSVSHGVLHGAHCPVAVVRPGTDS